MGTQSTDEVIILWLLYVVTSRLSLAVACFQVHEVVGSTVQLHVSTNVYNTIFTIVSPLDSIDTM